MNKDVKLYHDYQSEIDKVICDTLYREICTYLPEAENKVWHGHPVWFIEGNPIVGYSKLKAGIQLMFWSGISFDEELLMPGKSGKFKDASIMYFSSSEINFDDLRRWLNKSKEIQWDYKNIVKRKGILERLK
jgi:hypothetical protein